MIDTIGWAWTPALKGLVAFLAMLILTPLVIAQAHRRGWLAFPKADRWHARPTALMGGVAIYAAAIIPTLIWISSASLPWVVWAGATVMFVTGLVDDRINIRPVTKLLAQAIACCLLLYAGFTFGPQLPVWLSLPLTFLWIIGITNALNLLDNMDGLAAGIAGIAAAVLAAFVFLSGSTAGLGAALIITGAAGGFLIYNFKPARVFMGDSGSLFLGYMISALAIVIQSEADTSGSFAVYLVSAAVLAVPIFDTILVTIVRTRAGRPISQGGRDHSSHRLVFLGFSERRAVLTLYGISLVFGALALMFHFAEVAVFYALAAFFVLGLAIFGAFLGSLNVYQTGGDGHALQERTTIRLVEFVRAVFGRSWKTAFGFLGDLLVLIAAFVLAYHLRFEEGLTAAREEQVMQLLPVIVGIQLLTFYAFGLYRGIWKHAGTPEIVCIAKATTSATLLGFVAVGLLFGFGGLSRGVFIIDWMIVTLAVVGMRLSFRGIRHYIAYQRRSGIRVLLYGAGDAGIMTLRELRNNASLDRVPLGFLDDDTSKRDEMVQGLSVLGGLDELERICRQYQVQEVLITAFRMSRARKNEILDKCDRIGVPCRVFTISFSPLTKETLTIQEVAPADT